MCFATYGCYHPFLFQANGVGKSPYKTDKSMFNLHTALVQEISLYSFKETTESVMCDVIKIRILFISFFEGFPFPLLLSPFPFRRTFTHDTFCCPVFNPFTSEATLN